MEKEFDIVGIGNSLLDIIVEVDESILSMLNLQKGSSCLVDSVQGKKILTDLENHPKAYASGGSAANTVAGAALLGAKGHFMGVVGSDDHGHTYEKEMQTIGVNTSLFRHDKENTGYAITLLTADGERTFATHLGAASHFREEHISFSDIAKSKILHIEGYMLGEPDTREAVIAAMKFAHDNDTLVSLDLSASGVITNNLVVLKDIVKQYVDIVFVNEDEAYAFTGKRELDALHDICELCDIAVVKLGERGSIIKMKGTVHTIDPHVVEVMNTNGAGDMYAAGFLYGLARGHSIDSIGRVASQVAALVVASPGARIHEKHHDKLAGIIKNYSK